MIGCIAQANMGELRECERQKWFSRAEAEAVYAASKGCNIANAGNNFSEPSCPRSVATLIFRLIKFVLLIFSVSLSLKYNVLGHLNTVNLTVGP